MVSGYGARYRTRTCDLLHVKQVLYQLSKPRMSLRLVYYTKSKQKKQALFSKKMKKFRKHMK